MAGAAQHQLNGADGQVLLYQAGTAGIDSNDSAWVQPGRGTHRKTAHAVPANLHLAVAIVAGDAQAPGNDAIG
jgi:hypothetical protein